MKSMGKGEGKRTPVITSPLSSDLTGVRFQRRVPTPVAPGNVSLDTSHPGAHTSSDELTSPSSDLLSSDNCDSDGCPLSRVCSGVGSA